MKRADKQSNHLKLLLEQAHPGMSINSVNRPSGGWLHTVRQAMRLSLRSVADALKLSPQAIHQAEKSEANGTISLNQLEMVAGAMGCRVVYLLVPREGNWADRTIAETEQTPRGVQPAVVLSDGPGAEFPMALR